MPINTHNFSNPQQSFAMPSKPPTGPRTGNGTQQNLKRLFSTIFKVFGDENGNIHGLHVYTTDDDNGKKIWIGVEINQEDYPWFSEETKSRYEIMKGVYFSNSNETDCVYIWEYTDEEQKNAMVFKGYATGEIRKMGDEDMDFISVHFNKKVSDEWYNANKEWFESKLD